MTHYRFPKFTPLGSVILGTFFSIGIASNYLVSIYPASTVRSNLSPLATANGSVLVKEANNGLIQSNSSMLATLSLPGRTYTSNIAGSYSFGDYFWQWVRQFYPPAPI